MRLVLFYGVLFSALLSITQGVTGPGRNVALGEVPWQVLILHDNTTYKCGGTLYDENTVITAAHCLYDKRTNLRFPVEGIFVFAGGINEVSGDGRRAVRVSHPDGYVQGGGVDDIALIRVSVPFDFSEEIVPIRIAGQGSHVEIGVACGLSGFGYSRENGGTGGLREAVVEIRNPSICETEFGSNFDSSSMICAGGGTLGTGSCNGDSGGPLVCNRVLQGVVSYAREKCGSTGIPGTYTNVGAFHDWIIESTRG